MPDRSHIHVSATPRTARGAFLGDLGAWGSVAVHDCGDRLRFQAEDAGRLERVAPTRDINGLLVGVAV